MKIAELKDFNNISLQSHAEVLVDHLHEIADRNDGTLGYFLIFAEPSTQQVHLLSNVSQAQIPSTLKKIVHTMTTKAPKGVGKKKTEVPS